MDELCGRFDFVALKALDRGRSRKMRKQFYRIVIQETRP